MSRYDYHDGGSSKHRVERNKAPKFDKINVLVAMSRNDIERMIILLGWNLALRSQEIAGLRVANFDFQDMTVEIPNEIAKGKSGGIIPVISGKFMMDVQDHIHNTGLEDADFILNHGKDRKPYTTRHIRRMAKAVGQRSGIPWFHTHMLRHSMARWMLENSYNMSFVKSYLRHKSVRMTIDLYGHFDLEDRKRQAAQGKKPEWVY